MIFKNFFRKDLHLMNRWWHRLFFVVFIITYILTVTFTISSMVDDYQLPKYKKVDMLSDRMTNKVQLIGNLVESSEKIAVYEHNLYGSYLGDNFYDKNGGWLLEQQYYCANNISDHIEEISQITGVRNYKGNSELVSLDEFRLYLRRQADGCVERLKLNPVKSFADFSNPANYTLVWGLGADSMAVWQISILKTVFAVLLPILFTTIGFALLLVIYYKIFLFIVFGRKNTDLHTS